MDKNHRAAGLGGCTSNWCARKIDYRISRFFVLYGCLDKVVYYQIANSRLYPLQCREHTCTISVTLCQSWSQRMTVSMNFKMSAWSCKQRQESEFHSLHRQHWWSLRQEIRVLPWQQLLQLEDTRSCWPCLQPWPWRGEFCWELSEQRLFSLTLNEVPHSYIDNYHSLIDTYNSLHSS